MKKDYVWDDGSFRCVRVYDDHVEKIPVDAGMDEDFENHSNENEIKIYRGFGEKYHVLCPLDLEKSTVAQVVMRRVSTWYASEPDSRKAQNVPFAQGSWYYQRFLNAFLQSQSPARLALSPIEVAAAAVDFTDQMTKIYDEEPNLYDYLMKDLCPRNTGILNKRLVILDYGGVGEAYNF